MTCEERLDRILEAEPAELAGEADTALGRHIAGCERCAGVAAALLEETGAIDAALAELAGGQDPTDAADRALAAVRDGTAGAPTGARTGLTTGGRRYELPRGRPTSSGPVEAHPVPPPGRRRTRAWLPLAAAAVLAVVLLVPGDEPFPTPDPGTTVREAVEPRVSVAPPADRGAAIMETENPNITIVWLYEREGT